MWGLTEMTLENSLTKRQKVGDSVWKKWLTHPVALFLLLFIIRMLTTLPVLRGLTSLGVHEHTAKVVSQLPTVLVLFGLTAWFGWWKQVGFTATRWWAHKWDLAVLAMPVLIPLSGFLFADIQLPALGLFPMLLVDALIVAVWEELFFRGLLLESIRSRSPRYAVLIVAIIFGLSHSTNVLAGASLQFAVVQTLFAFLGAFGFTAARLRTQSLWPVIISHFLVDGLERLVAHGQAFDAPVGVMVTMLVVALLFAGYGYVTTFKGQKA